MSDVALVATIGTASVGLAAIVSSWNSGRADRKHDHGERVAEREHERDARLRDRRAELYVEFLEYLHIGQLRIDRTRAILAPHPPAPASADEREGIRMQARVAALASGEVRELAERFVSKLRGFNSWDFTLTALDAQYVGHGQAQYLQAEEALRAEREAASGLLKQIEKRILFELTGTTADT